jgi:flagellar biosynthesis protein FlhF
MKVKKYVAPSMPEAMKKIRAELGKDAVILNSKVIHTGGIFGFFTKKNIEVVAALDPTPFEKDLKQEGGKTITRSNSEVVQSEQLSSFEPNVNQNLKKEIDELKDLIKGMNYTSQQIKVENKLYPELLQGVYQYLIDQEIEESICNEILSSLLEHWYKNNSNSNEQEINHWLQQLIFQKVNEYHHGGISFTKQFVNVVGPTGVGKTTTLAKMAAECVIKHKKKVGFITTDTYRIAAIEQLKTYAKILNVPIEVCYNFEDFEKAKEKFSSYDIIFIDTAGRNFRNQQYVKDLKKVIDFSEEMETFLVLSLTAKYKDMKQIFEQFSIIKINRLIFTKVDETSQFGAILNLMQTYKTGVAYLTTGQNVPDDIIEATPKILVNSILGVDKQ